MNPKSQSVDGRSQSWLIRLIPVLILLLVLWQIPLLSFVQQQVGTRTLLQLIFRHGLMAAGPGRPALARLDPGQVQTAAAPLGQAQSQLDTNRTLGLIALTSNDLTGAKERLQRRLVAKPSDELAHFWLGETYLRLGNRSAGIEQWVAARAHVPLLLLVDQLRAQHGSTAALAALQTIIARDPTAIEARLLAIRLAGSDNNTAQITAWYQEIMRLEPRNIAARQAMAGYWLAQDNPEEALILAQEIIDIAPRETAGYVLAGDILFGMGLYESAETSYLAALPYAGQNKSGLLLKLGRSHEVLNHWSEAVATYEQALQLNPQNVRGQLLLAEAYCQLSRPAAALSVYDRTLGLDPDNVPAKQAVTHLTQYGDCPP